MRSVTGFFAAIGLLVALCNSSAIAEEKQDTATPVPSTLPVPVPLKLRGVPAWTFTHPEKFEVTHAATCETRFEGRRVDYKDRGASELQVRVKLEDDADAAKTLAKIVGVAGFIKNSDGTRWDYTLDKDGFKETRGDKVLRQLMREGNAEERTRVTRAVSASAAELTWDPDGNSRSALTADGLLEPLAETLALDRQVELLLPPIPNSLYEGVTFHQTVHVLSPAPLHGESLVKFTYRVDRVESNRVAEISFSGDSSELIPTGFEWGGIPLANATVKVSVHGKTTRDVRTQALTAAELEYDLQISSSKVDFASHLKCRDEWKHKD